MRRAIAITLSVALWTFAGCGPGESGPRDAEGQFDLAEDYHFGHGVGKDVKVALEWYRKAADQGHATAQTRLANHYADGKNIEKNRAEAIRLYKLAAAQGQPKAQLELGLAYRDGKGVPKDLAQAQAWLVLSAASGSRVATFMGKQLSPQLTKEQWKEARRLAHEWRTTYFSSRAAEAEGSRGG